MYVSEICADGIFVTFPSWLENVKSRSKIVLFSNERHFVFFFSKKKTITIIWSKLSKLPKKKKKNQFCMWQLYIFSIKQGKTRTSHAPPPHPLMGIEYTFFFSWRKLQAYWTYCSDMQYNWYGWGTVTLQALRTAFHWTLLLALQLCESSEV